MGDLNRPAAAAAAAGRFSLGSVTAGRPGTSAMSVSAQQTACYKEEMSGLRVGGWVGGWVEGEPARYEPPRTLSHTHILHYARGNTHVRTPRDEVPMLLPALSASAAVHAPPCLLPPIRCPGPLSAPWWCVTGCQTAIHAPLALSPLCRCPGPLSAPWWCVTGCQTAIHAPPCPLPLCRCPGPLSAPWWCATGCQTAEHSSSSATWGERQ